MNVEIEVEAALFPEKEYISGIFVAVQDNKGRWQIQGQQKAWSYLRIFVPWYTRAIELKTMHFNFLITKAVFKGAVLSYN